MECDKFFCGKSSFNRIELGLTDVSVSGCRGAVFFFRSRSQNNEVATARFGERAMGLLVVLECLARFLYEETNLHVDLVPRFSGVEHGPAGLVEQHGQFFGADGPARQAHATSTWSGWQSGVACRSRC